MLLARHRSLVKPFEPSSRAADFVGPNVLNARRLEIVDDAGDQRRLRPDHDEVDLVRLAERDHRRMVGDVERDAFGLPRDAGIARRADRAGRSAGWRRASRPARARARRSRGGECSCGARTSTRARGRRNLTVRPSTASTPASTPSAAGVVCLRHESLGRVVAAAWCWAWPRPRPPATTRWKTGPRWSSRAASSTRRPIRRASAPPRSGNRTPAGATASRAAPGRWNIASAATDRRRLPAASRRLRPVLPARLPRHLGRPAARLLRLLVRGSVRDGRSVVG